MTYAYDIPGYAQGHRFSDDPRYYDSTNERFYDLAGGDRFGNYVQKRVGTPVFQDRGSNSRRGLYLDNQTHWQFPHACPWQGSGLWVVEIDYITTGTTAMNPLIFADEIVGVLSSSPKIGTLHFSGQRRVSIDSGAAQLVSTDLAFPDAQIAIFAWSRNQQDRYSRYTRDGVTVTATGPYNTSRTDGLYIGLQGQPHSVLGALLGDYADTTDVSATNGTIRIFEQHYWKDDILSNHLSKTKDFIDYLKDYYAAV